MQAIIKSTNPNLLSILNKNPNSFFGMFLKEMRNGVMLGQCVSEGEYHLFFQEGNDLNDKDHSFSEDASNQIDFQSFCNPNGYISLINNIIPDLIKEIGAVNAKELNWLGKTIGELDSSEYTTTITIPSMYIDSTWAKKDGNFVLARYFPEIKNFTHKVGHIYTFQIECDSIVKAINLTLFVSMMMAVVNKQYFRVDQEIIDKYIKILSNIGNVPYFIVYLFKIRLLNHIQQFDMFKEKLEQISNAKLTFGSTHDARIDFVRTHFATKADILDIGCGELIYAKKLIPKLEDISYEYYGVDIDEDYAELATKVQERYKNKIHFSTTVPELTKPFTAICSEVIEHMDEEESIKILQSVLANENCLSLILTTPNKDFNKFYLLEENELRREDHLKEFDAGDFLVYINKLFSDKISKKYSLQIANGVGDTYQGVQPTFGLILRRTKKGKIKL